MGHLSENNITYVQHFLQAWKFIFKLCLIIGKLVIHSILPNTFIDTGVKKVIED